MHTDIELHDYKVGNNNNGVNNKVALRICNPKKHCKENEKKYEN